MSAPVSTDLVRWLSDTTLDDVPLVGGKNASLGEMVRELGSFGIRVPDGFCVTAAAYSDFLAGARLDDTIRRVLDGLDTRDVDDLQSRGAEVRHMILAAPFPPDLERAILDAYARLRRDSQANPSVAVRSAPPPKTCRRPALPASRKPISTCKAARRCWTPVVAASRRCLPIERFPIGSTRDSIMRRSAFGWRATDGALGPGRLGRHVHD